MKHFLNGEEVTSKHCTCTSCAWKLIPQIFFFHFNWIYADSSTIVSIIEKIKFSERQISFNVCFSISNIFSTTFCFIRFRIENEYKTLENQPDEQTIPRIEFDLYVKTLENKLIEMWPIFPFWYLTPIFRTLYNVHMHVRHPSLLSAGKSRMTTLCSEME